MVELRLDARGPAPLKRVEISLSPDDKVCVTGAPGSGRSTLCRLLAGVLTPAEGGLFLDGEPYPPPDGRRPAPVGYLPFPAPQSARAPRVNPEIARTLRVEQLLQREGPFSTVENQFLQLGSVLSRPHRFLALDQPLAPLGAAQIKRVLEVLEKSPCGILLTAAEPLDGWRNLRLEDGGLVGTGP